MPKQLDVKKGTRFEQVFHRDSKNCTCEMPMTSKKWNDAVGTFVTIRLCCMAKLIEKIAQKLGIESGAMYEVFDFDPKWVWDCEELHETQLAHETEVVMRPRGAPPKWLKERMQKKGIEIRNLPDEEVNSG